ncbi:MAG: MFS transporter, partial [Acidobacteriota bacterium]
MTDAKASLTWRFPTAFWTGNVVELFERAAYYGTFIALALYLTDVVGFSDVQAGWIG